ncbi:hypothetical protein [Bacillus piscicola]|uniref:hypothetical protein n=1 Tax=Bacillus piscicola TaxID=1632684 RepID=UPI001F08D71D|nr:hypothetical protein [Bacillus piscicola]
MKPVLFNLIPLLFILSACSGQPAETNYYLSLPGESDTWKLTGYEMMLTEDGEKAGNGTLEMKGKEEYVTDFFSFNTHIVVNGEDTRIHGGSVSGRTDISEETTGAIEGSGMNPISLREVDHIYMIVEWWDTEQKADAQERIHLYRKPENGETFLND